MSRVKLLLVDDNESGLLALEAVLGSGPYHLTKARSGWEAIDSLSEEEFAVILMDVQMPEMDGFETAQKIREDPRGKNVPIIFITAIDKDARYVRLGYDMGAVDYLFKPFDPHILKSKVAIFAQLFENKHKLQKAHDLLELRIQERTAQLLVLNAELKSEIHERQKTEEALRDSEKIEKEFVANVSHDFRTPVAAIKGSAETLRRGAIHDPKNAMHFVKIIERHAERLEYLVEDLLTLSSIESGKIKVQPKSINLQNFVVELVKNFVFLINSKNISVKIDMDKDLCVWADESQLYKICQNLFTNSVKYNRQNGSVLISAKAEGGKALIAVNDTGIGIPGEHLPRVFERFYRADRSRQREAGDTGLGLHIVKHLVESNGGNISVESEENKGSTFSFALPLSFSEASLSAPAAL